ncbi:sulfurtransferase [Salinithrix halophila]|uniref:Sulfurtransferase n=1 Tax=Salinithrix halophila TaxID=1485204 RepID=A0ABV8JCW1_9BACL
MAVNDALVTTDWLNRQAKDPDVVIADCRFELGKPEAGMEAYQRDHIPGAIYFHLEEDLSGSVDKHGGRHPLPDMETFAKKLGRAGIDSTKTVIAYDDQGGAMAARLWWMLRYLGHEKAAVLNGGYKSWKEEGRPVTAEIPQPEKAHFEPRIPDRERLAGMEETKRFTGLLIDSRDPARYEGKTEPIDAKAGHIPGAVNYFWKQNLAEGQTWKSPEELKKDFAFISEGEKPIVYCGSGVTACANLLALHQAGIQDARLYAGSWSDWISYVQNPVKTGPETLRPVK